MDGLEVCRKLRAAEISCPILMLTAKSEEIDKVLGLENRRRRLSDQAFSIREFLARVKAIFRRSSLNAMLPDAQANMIKVEDLTIDQQKRKIMVGGNRVDLTPKEYDLLQLLVTHPGKSYSREDLIEPNLGL